jgi:hypothetical protein
MTNPDLDETQRAALAQRLGSAHRAVRDAKENADLKAEHAAHKSAEEAKRALDERGPVGWGDGAPWFSIGTWRKYALCG